MEEILGILYGAAAVAVTAVAGFLAAYLRSKGKIAGVELASWASNMADQVVDRNVEAVEQTAKVTGVTGSQKKTLAEIGIKGDLADLGKAVGGTLLRAAVGSLSGRIEASVLRKFGGKG